MAFRDYSRLFGLADEQQRKRVPFGSQGAPDLFAGSNQHQQALAEGASGPGIAESLIGAGSQLAGAYIGRPQLGEKLEKANNKPLPDSVATDGSGVSSDIFYQQPMGHDGAGPSGSITNSAEAIQRNRDAFFKNKPFGGFRRYGGYVDPSRVYKVGENGEEYFVPDEPGTIVPINDPPQGRAARPLMGPRGDQTVQPPDQSLDRLRRGMGVDYPGPPDGNGRGSAPPTPGELLSQRAMSRPAGSVSAERSPLGDFSDTNLPEKSPYDGKTRRWLGSDASPRERAMQEIQDLQRAGPRSQRQSKLWKRVGQGILGGLSEWAAAGMPGGIGGAIGAVGAGASIYGAAPGAAADMEYRRKLAGLFGRYK